MDWPKVVDAIEVTTGTPDRNAALVLLWSISQARFGRTRTVPWSEASSELADLFSQYGLPDTGPAFAGLAPAQLWDATGGLPEDVYQTMAKDAGQRQQLVDLIAAKFFTRSTADELLASLGLAATWKGYGPVPGIEVGRWFRRRVDAADTKVHRPLQNGICGTPQLGCESIAIVGGYEDDVDNGDEIIYTGEGGRDPKTGKQNADQKLERGNAALATSVRTRNPIRVLRGSTKAGYTYAGLFLVEDFWRAKGKSGFWIWQFRLTAVDSAPPTEPVAPRGNARPGRRVSHAERLLRSAMVAEWVKKVHDHRCQFCNERYDTPAGPYAETAHIRPLGGKHAGPDLVENALCLCPTHHKLFDLGAFIITDDRIVMDVMARRPLGPLTEVGPHQIDLQYAAYHRELRPAP
ncbi:YDG/SRA domain-containing protein [Kutzneria sp. CA-103260]|uniref:YDG/SRA domain-containing protein n=1 Tax=Kutzneria sp. CA-103260 TaxID=2802641 RepID=UPI001BAAAE6A|nr:YDG/SRA domain-containing protein [Kutzneria sp. CA-103260]QUQ67670.1 SAD/SRA domain protein [Kutzneria sp. CA-103260]